jgi:intracellular septation protein A
MYRARRAFAQGGGSGRSEPSEIVYLCKPGCRGRCHSVAQRLRLHYVSRPVPIIIEESVPSPAANRPKWLTALIWVFTNFGPLIVFVAFEHLYGLFAAIVSGIVSGAILVAWQIIRERKISPFTAFIAASVVGFGVLDLHYQTGFFVKIEPALGNALTGCFFLGTVVVGRPIVIEFAEKAMGRALPVTAHPYLRNWTIVWGLFFFVRAAVFVWMAYRLSIDRALAIRGIIGPTSFGVMFLVEMATRRLCFPKKKPDPASEQIKGTS